MTLYDKVISVPGAEDSFELIVETMRRSTRNGTPEQIDVLRTYRVSSADDNTDKRNTETDNTYTNSYSCGQQERPVDTDRVHNNSSPARQNNQYQPRRSNYTYRGNNRRDTWTCHLCQEQGHIFRFCPQLPAALNFLRAGNSNAGPTQQ